jgi:anionic cell wall polymer biosynthesis LytR-Cps2A-Psr (LCP) family protein
LGGVWIDIDSSELEHINNYQLSIVRDTDIPKSEYVPVTETGRQKLNGLQAAAYCRIRYTKGDDFMRTARQREVVMAMSEQAKEMSLGELTDLLPKVLKHVYTSVDETDMVELLKNISKYYIEDEGGFPAEGMVATSNIGSSGSCVIPIDLEKNVIWLHEVLFDEVDYEVSSAVKECSKKIKADTAPYINNQ